MLDVIEKSNKGRKSVYPYHELDVGQGFQIPASANVKLGTIRQSSYNFNTTLGKTFKQTQLENGTIIVWREA